MTTQKGGGSNAAAGPPLTPRTPCSAHGGVFVPRVGSTGQVDAKRRHQHFNPGLLTVFNPIELDLRSCPLSDSSEHRFSKDSVGRAVWGPPPGEKERDFWSWGWPGWCLKAEPAGWRDWRKQGVSLAPCLHTPCGAGYSPLPATHQPIRSPALIALAWS